MLLNLIIDKRERDALEKGSGKTKQPRIVVWLRFSHDLRRNQRSADRRAEYQREPNGKHQSVEQALGTAYEFKQDEFTAAAAAAQPCRQKNQPSAPRPVTDGHDEVVFSRDPPAQHPANAGKSCKPGPATSEPALDLILQMIAAGKHGSISGVGKNAYTSGVDDPIIVLLGAHSMTDSLYRDLTTCRLQRRLDNSETVRLPGQLG